MQPCAIVVWTKRDGIQHVHDEVEVCIHRKLLNFKCLDWQEALDDSRLQKDAPGQVQVDSKKVA